jgi:adenosylmethionine-8-amino-7-oxononanoate aminotransferase
MSRLLRPYSVPLSPVAMQLVRGEGCNVYDQAGKRYLDAASGLWNVSLGLAHPELLARMQLQAQTLAYGSLFDSSHVQAELLSERLVGLSNGDFQFVYLSTTGSSAVELALTLALLHHRIEGRTERTEILAFDSGYHGGSFLPRAASGILGRELRQWGLDDARCCFIPSPADEARSLQALAEAFALRQGRIGCFIMEPILGSAGIVIPSTAYGQRVTELCKAHNVFLIADEVATGGGRCGSFFASNLVGLGPDILVLGKGLTAGYFPLSATMFSERVLDPFIRNQIPIPGGSTQDGNPIGCALAMGTLDLIRDRGLLQRAAAAGMSIRRQLRSLIGASAVRQVRGEGLMIGIALGHNSDSSGTYHEQEAARVRESCRQEGLLVYHFDSGISLFPPLTITDAEISEMLSILTQVLALCA